MAGTLYLPLSILAGTPPAPGTAPSPTGRDPTFIWTPEWQYTNELMETNNHWYYVAMKANADLTGTGGERYGDMGEYCAYIYQVTGDTAYGRKSWDRVRQVAASGGWSGLDLAAASVGSNNCRENFAMACVIVDWIWPVLDSTERTQAMGYLSNWCDYAQKQGAASASAGGFALTDSDPLFGYYGGVVALHYFNEPENALYGVALTRASGGTIAMGGLDGPAAAAGSVRARQYELVTSFATGGSWIESSEYNHGTSQLAFLLWQITQTATGTDYYPELAQFFADYQYRQWHEITPDFEQVVYWGDEQDPRQFNTSSFRYSRYWGRAAIHLGALKRNGFSAAASFGSALSEAFYANNSAYLTVNQNAWSRSFLGYDPYVTPATLPSGQSAWWCSGMDMQYVKDDQSLFWAYVPQRMGIDHNLECGSHFQLWRDGSWVVREPQGYDTDAESEGYVQWSNVGKNSVILAGLPGHMWDRGLVRQEEGADWWAITSQTNGSYYVPTYFDPPAEFCHDAERRLVYFKEAGFDVVVIRDIIDAEDPETLANFSRYRASSPNHQAMISAKDAVKVVVFHTETEPNIVGQVADWTSDGTAIGGVVTTTKCHTLLPAAATLYTVDEATIFADDPGITAPERKWQLRVRETTEGQVTTFLHVIISGNGTQPAISGASSGGVTVGTRTVTFGASTTTVS